MGIVMSEGNMSQGFATRRHLRLLKDCSCMGCRMVEGASAATEVGADQWRKTFNVWPAIGLVLVVLPVPLLVWWLS